MVPKLLISLALLALLAAPAADAHTLTYTKAKRAANKKADSFARTDARVKGLLRLSRHRYEAHAEWSRTIPGGCRECGENPATGQVFDTDEVEYCSAEIAVVLRGGRIRTRVTSSECG